MSLPDRVEVSSGSVELLRDMSAAWRLTWTYHDDEPRPPEPVELVDEQRIELALPGILQEPAAFRPLMQRDGARYAVVRVDLRHFQPVQLTVLIQKLARGLKNRRGKDQPMWCLHCHPEHHFIDTVWSCLEGMGG